jgi:beta-galactosidase
MPWDRDKVELRDGWRFLPERSSAARCRTSGEPVALPHCWNSGDAFQPGVAYRRGWGTYTVSFDAPPTPGEGNWWLVTEGFYGWGKVWLNGRSLGAVDGEYLGIEVPLGGLRASGNELVLALCNRYRRDVLPGQKMPDFLLYGGLSGRAWLEFRPVAGFRGFPVVRTDLDLDSGRGELRVQATCGEAAGERLVRAVVACAGVTVAEATRPVAGNLANIKVDVPGCHPWSCEDPFLYTLQLFLEDGDEVLDGCHMSVGFRHLEWRSSSGVWINGERVPLHGVNRHESMPGMGRALDPIMHARDAEQLACMGMNVVRLAHYPQHPSFLDRCDQLGILVFPEIASWKSVRGWGRWLRNARRQLNRMMARDGHRPGIILWGMGNESRSRRAYRLMSDDVEALDDRPVTYAENHLYRARRYRTLGSADVWGINYEFEEIEGARRASRLDVALVSECANAPHARRGDLREELIQVKRVLDAAARSDVPGVAGFVLWCFNDYATLRKGRYLRYSGMVDAWRQPKLSARVLAARYAAGTSLVVELRVWRGRLFAVVVGNVGDVRLRIEGMAERTIAVDRWACVPLDGERVSVVAESLDGAVVASARGSMAAPEKVHVQMEPIGEADAGFWVAQAWVMDGTGTPCVGWNGELQVEVKHGSPYCYRDGVVRVDGGQGLLYIKGTTVAAPSVSMHIEG